MDDEQKEKTNVHYAKGKSGVHKRYYTGKKRKQKSKKQKSELLDFDNSRNEPVVFRRGETTYLGWLVQHGGDDEYVVSSVDPSIGAGRTFVIKTSNQPVLLRELKIVEPLEKGAKVLFAWDFIEGEFVELRQAVCLCEDRGCVWLKPELSQAIRTELGEICFSPYALSRDCYELNDSAQTDVNVVGMIIARYESDLRDQHNAHVKMKTDMAEIVSGKVQVQEQLEIKKTQLEKSLGIITALKSSLAKSKRDRDELSKRMLNLVQLMTEKNNESLSKHSETVEQRITINELSKEIKQVTKLKYDILKEYENKMEETSRERNQREQAEQEKEQLEKRVWGLEKQLEILKSKQAIQLEQRPGTLGGHDVALVRPAGSMSKAVAMVQMMVPQKSSSAATTKVLDARAKEMYKIMEILSSRTTPQEEDLVATLAALFRRCPSIAASALKKSSISVHRELTPGETLDLKLLLRLPMRKFRQLRTFFSNHGVGMLASDRDLYREKAGRRDMSTDTVEVGEMALLKTATSANTVQIPFVRVRNLQQHIETLIDKKHVLGDMWDNDHFRNEIWIKIVGDKGGTSTKLAVQVTNIKDSNSADNTDLVALYNATDSYHNMEKVFGAFKDDLLKMQEVSQIRVGNVSKVCRIFLAGDYEFLTKTLGHMGPNASYPCLWCYIPLQALGAGGPTHAPKVCMDGGQFVDNPNWYQKRLPEDLVQDLANNKADPRRGGDTRSNGCYHHSMAFDPILPIIHDISHVVPPILHIMLGLVVRFYRLIEDLVQKCDQGTLNDRDEALNSRWEGISLEMDEIERDFVEVTKEQAFQEKMLQGFKKVQQGKRGRGASDPCALPACALSVISNDTVGDVQWVQCDTCGVDEESGWFHTDCVGLRNKEVEGIAFVCPVCKGEVGSVEEVVSRQEVVVQTHKRMVDELKVKKNNTRKELDKIYSEVKGHMGPLETKLEYILEVELGVKKQAYHSQCFVGNHCQKILNNSNKLIDVLEGLPEQAKLRELFTRLRNIFKYTEARFLSDSEVSQLSIECWKLGEWFPRVFPEERIPPKLHMLICHIPECASSWNTLGLLGEHGIESIHAQVNADERIFGCVRDAQTRLKYIFSSHGQRLLANKSHIAVSRRKCIDDSCGGRYKTVNNIKRCQKCNKIYQP